MEKIERKKGEKKIDSERGWIELMKDYCSVYLSAFMRKFFSFPFSRKWKKLNLKEKLIKHREKP